jgi:hypothetical protein
VREQRHRLRINELQNKIVGIPRDVLLILHVPALLERGKAGAAETPVARTASATRENCILRSVIEIGLLMRLVWMAKKKKRQVLASDF